jgi:hypothetical protein
MSRRSTEHTEQSRAPKAFQLTDIFGLMTIDIPRLPSHRTARDQSVHGDRAPLPWAAEYAVFSHAAQ